jgi:hypothetical protein
MGFLSLIVHLVCFVISSPPFCVRQCFYSNPCNFCKDTGSMVELPRIVALQEESVVTEDSTNATGNYPAQNRYIIDPPYS